MTMDIFFSRIMDFLSFLNKYDTQTFSHMLNFAGCDFTVCFFISHLVALFAVKMNFNFKVVCGPPSIVKAHKVDS